MTAMYGHKIDSEQGDAKMTGGDDDGFSDVVPFAVPSQVSGGLALQSVRLFYE